MPLTTDLFASFASACEQHHRLIALDFGDDGRWNGRQLLQRTAGHVVDVHQMPLKRSRS